MDHSVSVYPLTPVRWAILPYRRFLSYFAGVGIGSAAFKLEHISDLKNGYWRGLSLQIFIIYDVIKIYGLLWHFPPSYYQLTACGYLTCISLDPACSLFAPLSQEQRSSLTEQDHFSYEQLLCPGVITQDKISLQALCVRILSGSSGAGFNPGLARLVSEQRYKLLKITMTSGQFPLECLEEQCIRRGSIIITGMNEIILCMEGGLSDSSPQVFISSGDRNTMKPEGWKD